MEISIPAILLQAVIVPLIAAIACAFLGKHLKKKTGWIAAAATLYSTALLAYVAVQMWTQGGTLVETYTWGTIVFQLDLGFLADGLSIPVALVMSIVCTAMTVYSINYMDHRIDHLYGKDKPGTYAPLLCSFPAVPRGLNRRRPIN